MSSVPQNSKFGQHLLEILMFPPYVRSQLFLLKLKSFYFGFPSCWYLIDSLQLVSDCLIGVYGQHKIGQFVPVCLVEVGGSTGSVD